jgi:hypothetical protein
MRDDIPHTPYILSCKIMSSQDISCNPARMSASLPPTVSRLMARYDPQQTNGCRFHEISRAMRLRSMAFGMARHDKRYATKAG